MTDPSRSLLREATATNVPRPAVLSGARPRRGRTSFAWVAAALAGLVAGISAALAVAGGPATWTSSATLLIDQPQVMARAKDAGEIDKLTQLRGKYTGLVFTRVIAGPVAAKVGEPVQVVSTRLFATAPPESLLVVTGARSSDPQSARHLAAATATVLSDYLQREQRAAKVPAADRVVLSVVTPAGSAVKVSPSHRRVVTTGAAVGVIVLLGALLVVDRRLLRRLR